MLNHLTPESTFEEAIKLFDEKALDFCCLVDGNDCLRGVLTRTDIFRAPNAGARLHTKVRDFMVADPVTVTANDSSLVAATTMRDHGLKWLPVVDSYDTRRLTGYLRVERMLNLVLQKTPVDPWK